VPVFQFGAVLAGCTLVASLLTMAIAPLAMLPPFPLEIPVRTGTRSRLADMLNWLTIVVARHPGSIVLGILAVVLPLALGLFRLQFESNYINAFKPNTRVVVDYRETEERLGGIGVISLVVPAQPSLSLDELLAQHNLGEAISRLRHGDRPAVSQVV